MASISCKKLKDGRLSFQIYVYLGCDAEGKKIRKTTTFIPDTTAPTKARKAAETFAADFEQKVLSGDMVCGDKVTFSAFVDIWKKNWLPAKAPRTREQYLDLINQLAIPKIGMMKMTEIRPTHIDMILNARKEKGKAAATVRKDFTPINSVFKYAVKKGYIRENPCDRRDDLPTIKAKGANDIRFFTEDQARRFMKDALTMEYLYTCKTHRRVLKRTGESYTVQAYREKHSVHLQWQIYFMMAIYGTFRRAEMVALTWKDLDMKKNMVSVKKSVSQTREEGQFVKDPKTAAGVRDLILPSDVFTLLKRWKMEQRNLCTQLGTAWKGHRNGVNPDGTTDSFDENTVFIQLDNGLPINLTTPGHKFHEIVDHYNATCKKAEDQLPRIRLHDLRHTGATLLLGENTDIETVSRRLGHSKASVTLDIYGHALPENDKKASDTLETMFS